jgi:hypothetical protein
MCDGLCYRLAWLIERVTRARDHIWAWRPASCWHCGRPTHWVEINYEARLHRGRCTREKDAEFHAALRRTG